jgi:hypothetical protein
MIPLHSPCNSPSVSFGRWGVDLQCLVISLLWPNEMGYTTVRAVRVGVHTLGVKCHLHRVLGVAMVSIPHASFFFNLPKLATSRLLCFLNTS